MIGLGQCASTDVTIVFSDSYEANNVMWKRCVVVCVIYSYLKVGKAGSIS